MLHNRKSAYARALVIAMLACATNLMSGFHCSAQYEPGVDEVDRRAMSQKETREHLAFQQIKHLRSGVLLIRLQTRQVGIDALRSRGMNEEAERMDTEQKEMNDHIIKAFKDGWDFSPVYFFYSDDSEQIMNRDWNKVELKDVTGTPTSPFAEAPLNFLIAEFGSLQQYSKEVFELHYVDEQGKWKKEIYTHPGPANYGMTALHVISNRFDHISKPFPAYVRTFDPLPFRRKPPKAVKRLNKKMHDFAVSHKLP